MPSIETANITDALKDIGVRAGQTIYVYSDLMSPGMVKGVKGRDEFCQAYLGSILDLVGETGTVVVPAYTPQVARFNVDFDTETTPSLCGIFSEYVRHHPDSIRSDHPIRSVSAIGAKKEFICRDLGTSDFNWNSAFHRLHQAEAKVLSIGLCPGYSLGMCHYVEALCGAPYIYNKLLVWPSKTGGKRDPRQFFASVRHLKLEYKQDFSRWGELMHAGGHIKGARLGGSFVALSDYSHAFDIAANEFKSNPYFFLDRTPNFVFGEVPYDGPTAGLDGVLADEILEQGEHKVHAAQVEKRTYLAADISQKIIGT